MLTGFEVPSWTCKCLFYRPEYNAKGKVLKCKNEIYQLIELKEKMGTMGSFV